MQSRTLAEHAYQVAWRTLGPAVQAGLWHRGGVVADRLAERRGRSDRPRPEGPLLLLHAAGRGETTAARALARGLREVGYAGTLLLTTSSPRSAPVEDAATLHQYLPLDDRRFVGRFLEHWRPDGIAIVAADLWPNFIGEASRRAIPLALCSAAISDRSARRWSGLGRPLGRAMFPRFAAVMATDGQQAERLRGLGAETVQELGCLKAASPRLPVEPTLVEQLRRAAAGRVIVAAACTHDDSEAELLEALARPDRLLLVAPRYPDRWTGGPTVPRRSRGSLPGVGQDRWLADTFGELGSLYEAADVVVLGGSFTDHGGHNPAEPARFGRPVVVGPDVRANTRTVDELRIAGALVQAASLAEIGATVDPLVANPEFRDRMGLAATTLTHQWDERRREAARRLLELTRGRRLGG